MTKISLRVYNREIETMIDRGQTEEAIAHCKFILKTYPKHLETYRLLGKTFLESQRYSEAADILQRILSVQPDDFVSQIGMSIIREDEGNLDAGIYHMERAFEIQPSNAAIQDELRRLYGRRDGIEPPKLRLTRGALVRMYARGDLYRQAIAESRAALKEDPQRLDLEIVLARMYFLAGQKAEAAEISSRLVTKLPYCYEANRILADVLPETSRADDARGVQQKLLALDPYLGYSEAVQGSPQSPDNAVTLDRLAWSPSLETDQQPAWARSLGIKIDDGETEKMPQWMNTIETGQLSAETLAEEPSARPFSEEPSLFENTQQSLDTSSLPSIAAPNEKDIPNWMQTAGWTISDHPAMEEPILPEEPSALSAAAPGELPDWLKEMAPDQLAANDAQGDLDWLGTNDALSTIPSIAPAMETPSPEVNFGEADAFPTANDDLPDWLKSPIMPPDDTLFTTQNDEPLPDWLLNTAEMQTPLSDESETSSNLDWPTAQQETSPAQVEVPPTFLEAATIPIDQEVLPTKTGTVSFEKLKPPENQPQVDQTIATAGETPDLNDLDQAMAWLESLAAKQGAEEETLLSRPDERPSAPPEWVAQAAQSEEQEPGALSAPAGITQEPLPAVNLFKSTLEPTLEENLVEPITLPEMEVAAVSTSSETLVSPNSLDEPKIPGVEAEVQPSAAEVVDYPAGFTPDLLQTKPLQPLEALPSQTAEPLPPSAEVGPSEEMDMDAAFAWLESLAAKQGADADSLLVAPEERQETAPDWVQQQAVEAEMAIQAAEPAERIPEWIKSSEETPVTSELSQPTEQDLPDWLKETESSPQTALQASPNISSQQTAIPEESGILEEPPVAEATPQSESDVPAWVQETDQAVAAELPAALFEQEVQEPPETQHPANFGITRPLPSWLAGGTPPTATPVEENPSAVEEPALPDWLKSEESAQSLAGFVEPVAQDDSEGPALPDWLKNLETETEEDLIPGTPVLAEIVLPAAPEIEISNRPEELIGQAQTALARGQIELALRVYTRLIETQQNLEETIHDLRDALYRYPVDSAIWQTLGDAYFQNNRVQDALEAYTKAEDFLK